MVLEACYNLRNFKKKNTKLNSKLGSQPVEVVGPEAKVLLVSSISGCFRSFVQKRKLRFRV